MIKEFEEERLSKHEKRSTDYKTRTLTYNNERMSRQFGREMLRKTIAFYDQAPKSKRIKTIDEFGTLTGMFRMFTTSPFFVFHPSRQLSLLQPSSSSLQAPPPSHL